jgi:hypothetical protein
MTTITPGLDAKALDRFGASLHCDIDKGLLYGASMIIARHGKIGLQKTVGTVSPDGRAGADDDLYLMMLLSKSFTATLMMYVIGRRPLHARYKDRICATQIQHRGQPEHYHPLPARAHTWYLRPRA